MIYDINTKNRSFIKIAAELRRKGVKNNKFMLALFDETLIGIDPRDKYLTKEQQLRIYQECCINKWYFLREVVRIPVEGLEDGIQYGLNLGNLTMSYLKSKNKNQIVLLPRQHGKTIGEICDDVWALNFACTNTSLIYLNKEFKDSKENLRRYKNIRLGLPTWLLELISDSKNDKDNEEFKLNATRNNSLKAMPAATTVDSADKLGRGLTTALVYADEFASNFRIFLKLF